MQLIDPRLDVVNGGTQATFKARLLVQAKLPFQFDNCRVKTLNMANSNFNTTDSGKPEQSQSFITLPLVNATNGDSLFNGPEQSVPEVPVTPTLVVVAFAGVAIMARRRWARRRA